VAGRGVGGAGDDGGGGGPALRVDNLERVVGALGLELPLGETQGVIVLLQVTEPLAASDVILDGGRGRVGTPLLRRASGKAGEGYRILVAVVVQVLLR
jgi:hypothetical protein